MKETLILSSSIRLQYWIQGQANMTQMFPRVCWQSLRRTNRNSNSKLLLWSRLSEKERIVRTRALLRQATHLDLVITRNLRHSTIKLLPKMLKKVYTSFWRREVCTESMNGSLLTSLKEWEKHWASLDQISNQVQVNTHQEIMKQALNPRGLTIGKRLWKGHLSSQIWRILDWI